MPFQLTSYDPITAPDGKSSSDESDGDSSSLSVEEPSAEPAKSLSVDLDGVSPPRVAFTQEQVEIFETRYKNG